MALFATSGFAVANPRTVAVKLFAQSCFGAFEQRRWLDGLRCVSPQALEHLADRYRAARLTPGYLAIPRELKLGFSASITKGELNALPTTTLLDGALAGAMRMVVQDGYRIDELRFRVTKVRHRIEEVFAVNLKVSVLIGGASSIRVRSRYEVLAHDKPGGIRLQIPKAVYELLRLDPSR